MHKHRPYRIIFVVGKFIDTTAMPASLSRLVLLAGCALLTRANECTDSCDTTYAYGLEVQFCGTDGLNHTSHWGAFDTNCYDVCGVMAAYSGTCGCPSNCFSEFGHGECSNSKCICAAEYTGVDCSLPSASSKCSRHGHIVRGDSSGSAFPFDYCVCDDGWTGSDCSSAALAVGAAPWGTLFDTDVYTGDDTYGDDHPIW